MPMALHLHQDNHAGGFTGMHISNVLTAWTATLGIGGAVVAEVVPQAPVVSLFTVLLAAIGLGSLWVKRRYDLEDKKLHVEDLEAELKILRERERRFEPISRTTDDPGKPVKP